MKKKKNGRSSMFILYLIYPDYFYIEAGKMILKLVKRKNWILSERPKASKEEEKLIEEAIPYQLDYFFKEDNPTIFVRTKSEIYNPNTEIAKNNLLLQIAKLLAFKLYLEEKNSFKVLEIIVRAYHNLDYYVDYVSSPYIDNTTLDTLNKIIKNHAKSSN